MACGCCGKRYKGGVQGSAGTNVKVSGRYVLPQPSPAPQPPAAPEVQTPQTSEEKSQTNNEG